MTRSPQLVTLRRDLRHVNARIGAVERHNGPNDPRLAELRRQRDVLRRELAVQTVIDDAPPLSAADRVTLRNLLTVDQAEPASAIPAEQVAS